MKRTSLMLWLPFTIFSWATATAQVDDLPEGFTKTGFIQNIKYDEKQILVNYITDNTVEAEVIQLDGTTSYLNSKKTPITINDLRSNNEIIIVGDKFKERKL